MDNVVPHLTEGLINLCKAVPEDPTDFLANFLNERADQIDEEMIKKRDEEIRRKAAEKNGNLSQQPWASILQASTESIYRDLTTYDWTRLWMHI